MKIPQEIEFKWSIARPTQFKWFEDAARQIGLKSSPKKSLEIIDYYVSDAGNVLKNAGKRCRIRHQNASWEFTEKSAATFRKGLARRKEENVKLNRIKNISQALTYCKKFTKGNTLDIIFVIKNKRTLQELRSPHLKLEASFDQVKILRGKKSVRMNEIELELKRGNLREFRKLTTQITKLSRLKPAKISKVATAMKTFRLL